MNSVRETSGGTGCLTLGLVSGFILGAGWFLLNLPRQVLQSRQRLLGMGQDITIRLEQSDPVADSIARGKAEAQRRRAKTER